MHSTVAALAGAREDLEAAAESGGVEGVPVELGGEVVVTVVHTNGVDLLFVALDAVGRADVVTEDPGLGGVGLAGDGVGGSTSEDGGVDRGEISVD